MSDAFVIRNLKIYLRDKNALFFSFAGVLVVSVLFLCFLKQSVTDSLPAPVSKEAFADVYVLSGIFALAPLTTTLGGYAVYIEDMVSGKSRNFRALPVSKISVALGYIMTSIIIGMGVCSLCFLLAIPVLFRPEGLVFTPEQGLKCLAIISLSVFFCAGFSFFLLQFIKTESGFSGLNVIVGSFSGFLSAAYLPLGEVDGIKQKIVLSFPLTHMGILLKQIFMDNTGIKGSGFLMQKYGFVLYADGVAVKMETQIFFIIASGFIFIFIGINIFCKK